jgi:hypothetical protein
MLNDKEVSDLIAETYQGFAGFRARCAERDAIRNGTQTIPLPDLYKTAFVPVHHSYEGQHAHNVQMQEFRRAKPVYAIYSRAIESERQKGAQSFEHYMNRQLIIWLEAPVLQLTGSDQVCRGAGMYKLDLRTVPLQTEKGTEYIVWADRPSRDGQTAEKWAKEIDAYKLRVPTPFILEAVDIRACAWDEGRDSRVVRVVEKSQRKVLDIATTYGWEARDGRLRYLGPAMPENYQADPRHKTVEFAEVCTADMIYHVIADVGARGKDASHRIVGQYPNPFGVCRYVLAPAIVRNEVKPEDRYVPLIEGSLKVAEERSYFGTLRKFAAACGALPIMDVVTEVDGQAYIDPKSGKPMTIVIEPFKPVEYQLPPGTKLQPRYHDIVAEMDRYDALLQQDLVRYGPSEVLTGGSAGEREPAWSLALRGEKAEGGIAPAIEGQRQALREIARQTAWCVKNYLKEDVLIWTVVTDEFGRPQRQQVRVRPDDIEEDFDIDVDMGYKNTALQLTNRESLRRGRFDGDVSRRRLQEDGYGVVDPAAEDMQIDLERVDSVLSKIMLWPTIQAAIVLAREKLGLPPASPDEIAAMQATVFGTEPEMAAPRRPAAALHTTEEAPPTPLRQRVM